MRGKGAKSREGREGGLHEQTNGPEKGIHGKVNKTCPPAKAGNTHAGHDKKVHLSALSAPAQYCPPTHQMQLRYSLLLST